MLCWTRSDRESSSRLCLNIQNLAPQHQPQLQGSLGPSWRSCKRGAKLFIPQMMTRMKKRMMTLRMMKSGMTSRAVRLAPMPTLNLPDPKFTQKWKRLTFLHIYFLPCNLCNTSAVPSTQNPAGRNCPAHWEAPEGTTNPELGLGRLLSSSTEQQGGGRAAPCFG